MISELLCNDFFDFCYSESCVSSFSVNKCILVCVCVCVLGLLGLEGTEFSLLF